MCSALNGISVGFSFSASRWRNAKSNTDTWQQEQDTTISSELHPSSTTHQSKSIPCVIAVPSKPTYGNLTILADPILYNYLSLIHYPIRLLLNSSSFYSLIPVRNSDSISRPRRSALSFSLRETTSFRFWREYGGSGLVRSQCPVDGLAELNRNGQWRWSWKCG